MKGIRLQTVEMKDVLGYRKVQLSKYRDTSIKVHFILCLLVISQ